MSKATYASCDECGKQVSHEVSSYSRFPDVPDGWFQLSVLHRGSEQSVHADLCSRSCVQVFATARLSLVALARPEAAS